MIHNSGNRLLDRLEHQFGKFALAKLLRWIAVFQVTTWVLSLFSPSFPEWITYDKQLILSGQVWRFFSWIVFPVSNNPLFVLFALFFLFFVNDGLESEWGSFRLNVYVFSSFAALSLVGLLPFTAWATASFYFIFYSSFFLAFAMLYPEQIISLFGIIPIKVKWLAWANTAALVGFVVSSPLFIGAGIVLLGLLPFFVTFVPSIIESFRHKSATKVRRHRFEKHHHDGEAFHECDICGATEITHPEREFRVSADGNERCNVCRQTN